MKFTIKKVPLTIEQKKNALDFTTHMKNLITLMLKNLLKKTYMMNISTLNVWIVVPSMNLKPTLL